MRSLMLVAMLVPLLFGVGCAKRNAKNKPQSQDDSASIKPQPAAKKDAGKKEDEPNWLNDSRFKKDPPADPQAAPAPDPDKPGGATGKQSWGLEPPQGGWQGAKPPVPPMPMAQPPGMPMPTPAPPGMGTLQPQQVPPAQTPPTQTPMAPEVQVTAADMKDVWISIENRSGASGKMPTPAEVYTALVVAKSPAADLVKRGAIVLTGATTREAVWAFEARAATQGGLVASQNGVETVTAAELKSLLGK